MHHPLFPAMVALWFGALFGLGSLAIRPGILESFVTSNGIDTLLPALAPPLGATARILLALAMAGGGGFLGATLAVRMARPKVEPRERKRSAAAVQEEQKASRFPSVYGAETGAEPGVGQGRKRSISLGKAEQDANARIRDDYHENAPLPGGSPQILDVADFDLDGFEEPEQAPTREPVLEADSDNAFARQSGAAPAVAEREASPPAGAQVFMAPSDAAGNSGEYDAADPAPVPSGRLFEDFSRDLQKPERLEDGEAKSAPPRIGVTFDVPAAAVPARAPVFVDPEPLQPLFTRAPAQAAAQQDAVHVASEAPQPAPFAAPEPKPEPDAVADTDQDASRAPVAPEAREEPVSDLSGQSPHRTGSEKIASSPLGSLSHLELLERLAVSLERRRAQALEKGVEGPQEPDTAEASDGGSSATPEDLVEPEAPETETATRSSAPFAQLPAAMRPLLLEDEDADDDEALSLDHVPQRTIAAAPSIEPPQAPQPSPYARPAPVSDQPTDAGHGLDTGEHDSDEDDVLAQGYSSLLNLSRPVTTRGGFVRVEEPEYDGEAIEPVVVFPGQNGETQGPFSRPAQPASAPEVDRSDSADEPAVPARDDGKAPFAAPAAESLPETGAMGSPSAGRADPEETERALRAALSTLQRMSGAA